MENLISVEMRSVNHISFNVLKTGWLTKDQLHSTVLKNLVAKNRLSYTTSCWLLFMTRQLKEEFLFGGVSIAFGTLPSFLQQIESILSGCSFQDTLSAIVIIPKPLMQEIQRFCFISNILAYTFLSFSFCF